jgi:hypothetical protein
MTKVFLDAMAIPPACELNKPIFKKLFLENGDLDIADKRALKDDIERIRWLYTLKPNTINIPKFESDGVEYQEIAILQIDLTNRNHARRIATFANKAIPYPLILLFSHDDQFSLNLANKRINQTDKSKWVVEEEWSTEWINTAHATGSQAKFISDCAIKNLSSLNFYAFYQDMVARVIALNAASRNGIYECGTPEKTADRRRFLSEISEMERQVAELRAELKKESQFNRKLELNVAIKERSLKIDALEKNL